MGSVVFTDRYTISSYGAYTQNVRVNYSESYDPATNQSTVSLTSVEMNSGYALGSAVVYGNVEFNGTTLKSMSGTATYQVNLQNSYTAISNSGGGSITVQHGSDGTATLTIRLSGGNGGYWGAYGSRDGKPNRMFGVSSPRSSSVALTTHTVTLTLNPNGGEWEGSSAVQTFQQAPTSTKTIADPTLADSTFVDWTLTGDGSLSAGVYTFGTANGTLKANWSYTITCEDRVGNSSGALLGSASTAKTYGETVAGSDWGSDATTSAYYTGYKYTGCTTLVVSGVATVYRYFAVATYTLSVTKSDIGITVNVTRTSSPLGGTIGLVYDGDTLYYNDVVKVTWSIASGYSEDTLTVNSEDVSALSPAEKTVTVTDNMTVVMLVELGAVVYIGNQDYQVFIYDGANWNQYEAYIYDGANWVAY